MLRHRTGTPPWIARVKQHTGSREIIHEGAPLKTTIASNARHRVSVELASRIRWSHSKEEGSSIEHHRWRARNSRCCGPRL